MIKSVICGRNWSVSEFYKINTEINEKNMDINFNLITISYASPLAVKDPSMISTIVVFEAACREPRWICRGD